MFLFLLLGILKQKYTCIFCVAYFNCDCWSVTVYTPKLNCLEIYLELNELKTAKTLMDSFFANMFNVKVTFTIETELLINLLWVFV